MKELPEEQTLIELLQFTKEAEQKVRELDTMGEKFTQKWENRLKNRNKSVQQQQTT
jgi:hypothetical protein